MLERPEALRALGAAVRGLRAERGLSQEALGEQAGISKNYVGYIEGGEGNPSFLVLLRLAEALGVELTELAARLHRLAK